MLKRRVRGPLLIFLSDSTEIKLYGWPRGLGFNLFSLMVNPTLMFFWFVCQNLKGWQIQLNPICLAHLQLLVNSYLELCTLALTRYVLYQLVTWWWLKKSARNKTKPNNATQRKKGWYLATTLFFKSSNSFSNTLFFYLKEIWNRKATTNVSTGRVYLSIYVLLDQR